MTSALVVKFASKYSVEEADVLQTLKQTCFKGVASDAQMTALLIVADQYGLNPFTKEIYAFPDRNNGIVPVVGVDGWSRIINEHPMFDGVEFNLGSDEDNGVWMECVLSRKDRTHPIKVREYMVECGGTSGPWKSHPRRMLRHKSLIQCARIAFGFVGIFDEDEAQRIIVEKDITPRPQRENPVAIAQQATATDNSEERARLIADIDALADNGTAVLRSAWEALGKEGRNIHGGISADTHARAKRADEFNAADE